MYPHNAIHWFLVTLPQCTLQQTIALLQRILSSHHLSSASVKFCILRTHTITDRIWVGSVHLLILRGTEKYTLRICSNSVCRLRDANPSLHIDEKSSSMSSHQITERTHTTSVNFIPQGIFEPIRLVTFHIPCVTRFECCLSFCLSLAARSDAAAASLKPHTWANECLSCLSVSAPSQ